MECVTKTTCPKVGIGRFSSREGNLAEPRKPCGEPHCGTPGVAFGSSGMGRQEDGDTARAAGEHRGFSLLLLLVAVIGLGSVAGELFLGIATGFGGGTL